MCVCVRVFVAAWACCVVWCGVTPEGGVATEDVILVTGVLPMSAMHPVWVIGYRCVKSVGIM